MSAPPASSDCAEYRDEMSNSIRRLQRRGLADSSLDPTIVASVLGSITMRFPEMWMVEHLVDCTFDDAVEHLAVIFIKALGLKEPYGSPALNGG